MYTIINLIINRSLKLRRKLPCTHKRNYRILDVTIHLAISEKYNETLYEILRIDRLQNNLTFH
ncbi:hypothetical protein RhiirA5_362192 [Rhizophagus irregularis]|uniref:Uncharacterized protein n=2 Tax=Rhizophagus irregularis TaxID=588596 RepID=A0A2I1EVI9_9GLOM|nr:hypothetical protein GLOIN_2v1528774 [Rhizophagus irregularis DAOM 181602=DAOM 197198]PKC04594.1 hypothetical protein RhiirA5_362192 [Rhizophagus irregularis]PKC59588.1 hypothetical protein RhiirA1_426798 [Rhizophagus irregularis]PKY26147.1 hypothetical protein RhiirB3_414829 [Rhizophagus irregularis]PKY53572.1 hypothetical protein RhiirA4_409147 [Rhizophagus irregularis]POG79218.1 hypothetical protein GLOIN_2v1528774 [Rhizophagus irregularis DAOM 181602=DAOM 197198]|eukprot:XP_025186084.1 hypothetical protein GLOIN_2v1528774 [Rhizophagus irregularis DAOM 181602=DAOM 197198]